MGGGVEGQSRYTVGERRVYRSVVLGKHETTSRMDEGPDGTDRTQE